jgi:hypothetical protein
MKKADTQTNEERAYLKARFDYLRPRTKGRSNRISSPFSGKNKAQRQRVSAGMHAMEAPKWQPRLNW